MRLFGEDDGAASLSLSIRFLRMCMNKNYNYSTLPAATYSKILCFSLACLSKILMKKEIWRNRKKVSLLVLNKIANASV
jgi:hypothetical protein